jgi:hypothetical protein
MAKGKGLAVARSLLEFKPDVVATQENISGKGPGYVFAESRVETVQTDAVDVASFIRERLDQL